MITIKGNTAENCGTLLELTAPHTANILVENNHGINISGQLINAKIFVDQSRLNAFLAEITPHIGSLDKEKAESLSLILQDLNDPDIEDKASALYKLAEFGKSVASGVVSAIITSFIPK
ncbi:hypothetical protein [Pseudomonas capeferrum]